MIAVADAKIHQTKERINLPKDFMFITRDNPDTL